MNEFQSISPTELQDNLFHLIGKDWTLITTYDGTRYNTMTASWGGAGVLWGKNVVFIFIRPQRYTYEMLEKSETFSLSFFENGMYREQLGFCGKASGRDTDKLKECGLTPALSGNIPYIKEARLTLLCGKLYFDDLNPAHFLDPSIQANYAMKDYHRMYIAEIKDIFIKK